MEHKKNFFIATEAFPHHLSVGAVVINNEGRVACNYFEELTHPIIGTVRDVYSLMRETVEPDEALDHSLARGLMEEMGIEATCKGFLGPIVSCFKNNNQNFETEKTTLYFLCELTSFDESKKNKTDIEAGAKIVWVPLDESIEIMRSQGVRLHREDADESLILERAKRYVVKQ